MGKRKPPPPAKSTPQLDAGDLRWSRSIWIMACVVFLMVVVGDLIYLLVALSQHRRHLLLPGLAIAAPITAVFLLVVSWWNWREVVRRGAPRPDTIDDSQRPSR